MPAFPKKWLLIIIVLAVVTPLLQPLIPNLVSDYRLFLVSTMVIAARGTIPSGTDRAATATCPRLMIVHAVLTTQAARTAAGTETSGI